MISRKRFLPFRARLCLCALALLAGLTAVAGCRVTPPLVKIGLVAPFEGAERDLGYDAIYAARLAVREINAAGGVAGVHLTLVALDDRGQADLARSIARSLALDPDVVGVIGHGRPATTNAARPEYAAAGISHLPLGQTPFLPFPSERLPDAFRERYETVTPFAETAGAYAAPTYDALYLLLAAMEAGAATTGRIDRATVANFLPNVVHEGITGNVAYSPPP